MRLWSIHPSYLDQKGLVAVWREGLLALHVLSGKTKGYKNHPQLLRFKAHSAPLQALTNYLHAIVDEAEKRGYSFKREKLLPIQQVELLTVTNEQLAYERIHLLTKLQVRDKKKYSEIKNTVTLLPHPLLIVIKGEVEKWEKLP